MEGTSWSPPWVSEEKPPARGVAPELWNEKLTRREKSREKSREKEIRREGRIGLGNPGVFPVYFLFPFSSRSLE